MIFFCIAIFIYVFINNINDTNKIKKGNRITLYFNFPNGKNLYIDTIDNKKFKEILQDFEKKYDLYISNTKIGGGIFRHKEIGNEGFEDLCKMDLKDLKILDLTQEILKNHLL